MLAGFNRQGSNLLTPGYRSGDPLLQGYLRGDGALLRLVNEQSGGLSQGRRYGLLPSQLYRYIGDLRQFRGNHGKIRKAVVQQFLTGSVPLLAGFGAHNYGNQLHAVPLCRCGQAVPRPGGEAGFQARSAGVKANQLIGVGQSKGTIPDGIHPDGSVLFDERMVFQQLPGHEGNVVSAGAVLLRGVVIVQPCAIDKMGILHPQFLSPLVHGFHEGGF